MTTPDQATIRVPQEAVAGQRTGWNCTLSYLREGKRHAYRVRVGRLVHGLTLIANEAMGRTTRSFYPMRLGNSQFSLGLILDGTRQRSTASNARWNQIPTEYEQFMSWLHNYMTYLLVQDETIYGELPVMSVSVPKYDFFREGVPLGPVLFGDHVGSMIWTPTLVFETTRDYLEPATASVLSSRFLGGLTDLDQEAQFFYPSSPMAEVGGNEAPFIFDRGEGGDNSQADSVRTADEREADEAGYN